MPIVDEAVQGYLSGFTQPKDPILAKLEALAAKDSWPIIPEATARFIEGTLRALKPERVLEVGTAIGYSAIRMARALPAFSQVDTIEKDVETATLAEAHIEEAGLTPRIKVYRGSALQLIPHLTYRYDVLFIDAEKREYEGYLALALSLVPRGGLILVDNLLWGGRAATGHREGDEAWRREMTDAIRKFNPFFLGHPQLDAQILPIGDGLGYAVKVA